MGVNLSRIVIDPGTITKMVKGRARLPYVGSRTTSTNAAHPPRGSFRMGPAGSLESRTQT